MCSRLANSPCDPSWKLCPADFAVTDTAVIRVENLGKKYCIKHQAERQRYKAFRDVLTEKTKSLAQRLWSFARLQKSQTESKTSTEDFWALKNVSFEMKRGDVIGIIGRNGAGKSTLLKILSRITEPSSGRVKIKGRVASLLEVGTGFHPELSGRENIFLNGAILGMQRADTKRKFDEIVAFAQVERFLDTPVKRYSSGMYVRLAFAVAAHLEPEILIVDEVLAVGDAEFQKKCLGRMRDVALGGRTVLFVSHNMAAIQTLCEGALLLQAGRLIGTGSAAAQIRSYLDSTIRKGPLKTFPKCLSSEIQLLDLSFSRDVVRSGESLTVQIVLASSLPNNIKDCALLIYSESGVRVAILDFRSDAIDMAIRPNIPWIVRGTIKAVNIVEGNYSVGIHLRCGDCQRDHYEITSLHVLPGKTTSTIAPYEAEHRGLVEFNFSIETCIGQSFING
jgi:lipopolysaccharide transport system ATP-binding protein